METEPDAKKIEENDTNLALNNSVLNYYKKFGKKRDLEQYFSLSTAPNDVKNRDSVFWKNMKSQQDSSDSDKRSESATELCRISIKCSIPDHSSSSQEGTSNQISQPVESQSPPIVTEDIDLNISKNSEAESEKCDLNISQKSIDPGLDTSTNRAISPTSSITSHRKLEWDSLADVGYDNEVKNSASTLSTLERLALRQQYTNNEDSSFGIKIGPPTAESTPLEGIKEFKPKVKAGKRSTVKNVKLSKKESEVVNVSMLPDDNIKSLNVNLTKHISFNVDKDGVITEKINKCSKEDVGVETDSPECMMIDKEIQTTLRKTKAKNDILKNDLSNNEPASIMININSLKKLMANRKPRYVRRNKRIKRRLKVKQKTNASFNEKSGEQVSEAESFEYMPGHIYNQNKHSDKNRSFAGNKSSLESSGGITTESSKTSTRSFSKDLEKGVELLNNLHNDSSQLKKKLIKDIVNRLVNSKYKEDYSFLAGLATDNNSLKLERDKSHHYTTSSTSDPNSETINKVLRPKKSILRKLDYSTTQSVPNLAIASTSKTILNPRQVTSISQLETDGSSKDKNSSENLFTPSEELYKMYLEARKKEHLYKMADKKRVTRNKSSNELLNISNEKNDNINTLVKDLIKNNYDGAGDAKTSKNKPADIPANNNVSRQVIHTVFTLSSSDYERQSLRKYNKTLKDQKTNQNENNLHHCCCKDYSKNVSVIDSTVKVNVDCLKIQKTETSDVCKGKIRHNTGKTMTTVIPSEVKYVCLCSNHCNIHHNVPENILPCKCVHTNERIASDLRSDDGSDCVNIEKSNLGNFENQISSKVSSKTSQTELNFKLELPNKSKDLSSSSSKEKITQINPKIHTHNNIFFCKYIQTDITINPKISEASISDVNIYNEVYVASHRTSGSSTTDNISNLESDTNINIKSSSESLQLSNRENVKRNISKKADIDCQTKMDLVSKESQTKLDLLDEYTLPLKGTNMELIVGIDNRYNQISNKDQNLNKQDNIEDNNVDERIRSSDEKQTKSYSVSSSNKTNNSNIMKDKTSPRFETVPQKKYEKSTSTEKHDKEEAKIIHNTISSYRTEQDGLSKNSSKNTSSKKQKATDQQGNIENTMPSLFENVEAKIHDLTKKNSKNRLKKVSIDEPSKYFTYPTQSVAINNNASNIRRNTVTDIPLTDYSKLMYKLTPKNSDELIYNKHKTITNKYDMDKEKENMHSSSGMSNEFQVSNSESNKTTNVSDESSGSDPIIELIKDITRRYSKRDSERYKRRKCFKEIMTVLNYLVDTDYSTDGKQITTAESSVSLEHTIKKKDTYVETVASPKVYVDKSIQLDISKETSSDVQYSSEIPGTSSDSQARKILSKIQKQCEEYSKKKRVHKKPTCETSSSTSANCEKCRKVHKCSCKVSHKCKNVKTKSPDKSKRKCIAYNLILQTSDTLTTLENSFTDHKHVPLRNIIVKVPSKHRGVEKKIQTDMKSTKPIKVVSPKKTVPLKTQRSKSLGDGSEFSSNDDAVKFMEFSVRDYLEKNRPDFIENTSKRQDCLKKISETRKVVEESDNNSDWFLIHQPQCYCMDAYQMYCKGNPPINYCHLQVPYYYNYTEPSAANARLEQRRLLSMRLARQPDVSLSLTDLHNLAKQLGIDIRRKIHSPKFISEKEMKKHSEKIYKTLPEVVRKKEERRKERIKKTNLLMASLFNKNLQKKTLQGAVNLSNYSAVIKI